MREYSGCPGPAPPCPQAALGRPSDGAGLGTGEPHAGFGGPGCPGRAVSRPVALLLALSERHPEMSDRLLLLSEASSGPRDTVLEALVHAGAWGASLPVQAAHSYQLPFPRPQAPGPQRGLGDGPGPDSWGPRGAGVCLPLETGDGTRQALSRPSRRPGPPSCLPRPCPPPHRGQCPWQAQTGLSRQGRLQPPPKG